jgi:hypothetical protein
MLRPDVAYAKSVEEMVYFSTSGKSSTTFDSLCVFLFGLRTTYDISISGEDEETFDSMYMSLFLNENRLLLDDRGKMSRPAASSGI